MNFDFSTSDTYICSDLVVSDSWQYHQWLSLPTGLSSSSFGSWSCVLTLMRASSPAIRSLTASPPTPGTASSASRPRSRRSPPASRPTASCRAPPPSSVTSSLSSSMASSCSRPPRSSPAAASSCSRSWAPALLAASSSPSSVHFPMPCSSSVTNSHSLFSF